MHPLFAIATPSVTPLCSTEGYQTDASRWGKPRADGSCHDAGASSLLHNGYYNTVTTCNANKSGTSKDAVDGGSDDNTTSAITERTEEDDTSIASLPSTVNNRGVHFNEDANLVYQVESRDELSPAECYAAWYSVEELVTMRQRVLRLLHRYTQQKALSFEEQEEMAGLEIYATTPHARARQRRLKHTQFTVVKEQETLRHTSWPPTLSPHADTLRHVSRVCSRFCAKEALQRARDDQRAIDHELRAFRIQQAMAVWFSSMDVSPPPRHGSPSLRRQRPPHQVTTSARPALQFFKVMLLDG